MANRIMGITVEIGGDTDKLQILGVAEKYQNRGIARELLAGAMEELRRRGCKSAHMLVAKDNVKALRSYEKLVFEKVGEYVLQGHDYWCFEKKL